MKAVKVLALLLVLVIAGQAQAASQPKVITMGYWESPNGELLVKETGALSEAFPDIQIRWLEFQSGTDILTAMQSGSLDFATIGTPPAVMGIINNYPFKVFYLHDVIGESEGLIVKKSSGIESIADLKGKKIAVPFGTTSHFAFLNVLKANGLKVSDFTLYDMTPPDIFAAWHRGDIDGAYTWESVKSQLIEADGRQLISSAEAAKVGGLTAEIGIVSTKFYAVYPDIVKKYIDILDEAVHSYRENQEAAAGLMAKGLGLPVKDALTAMNEIIVKDKSEQPEYFREGGELQSVLFATGEFLYDQHSVVKKPEQDIINRAILTELYE
ncbi:MAG: ABC transporter substrate-binding protein [Synergistaceae bacterium]|nr:ABC transporter substrate-binding protein [Synergistaceae bacterium]